MPLCKYNDKTLILLKNKMSKKVIYILIIVFSLSCRNNTHKSYYTEVQLSSSDKTIKVPVLKINKRKFTALESQYFKHSVGGEDIKERTKILMKYTEDHLEIKFECLDDPRLEQNSYTEDNTSLFNQEVLEFFISKGENSSEDYLEIEINPNNAMFLAKISYKYKTDGSFSSEYINTKTSGVIHSVEKDVKNEKWTGILKLPLKILDYSEGVSGNTFRMNIYRIISQKDHVNSKWRCTAENSTFACWSSTMAEKPQFHSPDYFGFLILE